jgi:DNA polymerase III subunit beta
MKFTVSSTDLLQGLYSVSRVIAAKNSLPILENFLFVLEGNNLMVTASDSETMLKTVIKIDEVSSGGEIAAPAKLLTDTLKELPTQPIEINTDDTKNIINIIWASGSAQIPYLSADEYPVIPELTSPSKIEVTGKILSDGINNTLYATSDDYLRPAMNGIFFDISSDSFNMVASNAHILAYFERTDIKSEPRSFSLPKKSANILKGILSKSDEEIITLSFDKKFAYFNFASTLVVCRLIEGNFPNYKAVMPKNNDNILNIARTDLLNATKRVAVCSNQATSQIILKLSFNQLVISAQDLDFSISAHETLSCDYSGDPMEIAVKSNFFIDILTNLPYDQVSIKLKDSGKPMLILPVEKDDQNELISVLLMPMIINY